MAALTRHTDALKAAGDARSRSQIMADSLTERLTGQAPAEGTPVELNLTVPVEHLLDPNDATPGEIVGHGPIPAGLVDDLLRRAGDRVRWRRLFTAPTGLGSGRMIVAGDPTARRFTGWLAKLLKLRDGGSCREPFCAAPIRHYDHITPYRDGGPTSYVNGRGVCERHNQAREMPGWRVETLHGGYGGHPALIATTTPTGTQLPQPRPQPTLS